MKCPICGGADMDCSWEESAPLSCFPKPQQIWETAFTPEDLAIVKKRFAARATRLQTLSANLKSSLGRVALVARVDQTLWNAHAGDCLAVCKELEQWDGIPPSLLRDENAALRNALRELLEVADDYMDVGVNHDLNAWQAEEIVADAKSRARKILKKV